MELFTAGDRLFASDAVSISKLFQLLTQQSPSSDRAPQALPARWHDASGDRE
jgi:hypothetical protein